MDHIIGHYASAGNFVFNLLSYSTYQDVNIINVIDLIDKQNKYNANHLLSCTGESVFSLSRWSSVMDFSVTSCSESPCFYIDYPLSKINISSGNVRMYVEDPLVVVISMYNAFLVKSQRWMTFDHNNRFFSDCPQFEIPPAFHWFHPTSSQKILDMDRTFTFLQRSTFDNINRIDDHFRKRSDLNYSMIHATYYDTDLDPFLESIIEREAFSTNITNYVDVLKMSPDLCYKVAMLQERYDYPSVSCPNNNVYIFAAVALTVIGIVVLVLCRSKMYKHDDERIPLQE